MKILNYGLYRVLGFLLDSKSLENKNKSQEIRAEIIKRFVHTDHNSRQKFAILL